MIKKISYYIWFSLLLFVFKASSQPLSRIQNKGNNNGVYLTSEDYNKGKLTPVNGNKDVKNKVMLHRIIGNHIEVITDGKIHRYNKDSIFGYHSNKDEDYRYYDKAREEYRIAEQQKIVIYILARPVYGVKNFTMAPFYYFSKTPESEIVPLSLMNIRRAFPNSFRIQIYLNMEFDETNISAYDEAHHMYKINYFLNQLEHIGNNTLK